LNTNKTYYFSILKTKVSKVFRASFSAPETISDWKGVTITDFQEDLRIKTKGSFSEKWFYTYMKNDTEKLPRIDMLNLLSEYVGYRNWNAFIEAQGTTIEEKSKIKKRKKPLILGLLILLPILVFGIYTSINKKNTFSFCFLDADKNTVINNIKLDITIFRNHESPIYLKTDSLGCFSYDTYENSIRFVVKSPYYKTDTIVRSLETKHNTIQLKSDDYALMLKYYLNSNEKDWKKRRAELQELIDDEAQIYRLFESNIGIERYAKQDFINMLTIPTSSLKNLEVIDRVYKNDKIVKLKFIVK